jgi:hypothetical protein
LRIFSRLFLKAKQFSRMKIKEANGTSGIRALRNHRGPCVKAFVSGCHLSYTLLLHVHLWNLLYN